MPTVDEPEVGTVADVLSILNPEVNTTVTYDSVLKPNLRTYNDSGVVGNNHVIIGATIKSAREVGGGMVGVIYDMIIQIDVYNVKAENASKLGDKIITVIMKNADKNGQPNRRSSLFTTLQYIRPSKLDLMPVFKEGEFYRKVIRLGAYTKS